jgi:hypothetical protein
MMTFGDNDVCQSEATEMMELKDQGMQMALEQSKKAIDTRNEVTVLSNHPKGGSVEVQ